MEGIPCVRAIIQAAAYPFKRQSHKMVKHTQTTRTRRQSADKLFECV